MEKKKYLIQLGIEIKKYRIAKHLSQEKLALKCEFDRTYISLLERGKRNPSFYNLIKLCRGLEIQIHELLKEIN